MIIILNDEKIQCDFDNFNIINSSDNNNTSFYEK